MWKKPYAYCVDFLPLTGSSGVSYTDFDVKVVETNFEIIKLIHKADSDAINVKLMNSTTGRYYFSPQADIRFVSGSAFSGITVNGFISCILPTPTTISRDASLVYSASDKSGSSNNLRVAMWGNQLFNGVSPYEKRTKREMWEIPIDTGTMAAYGSITKNITIEGNAGMLVHKLTGLRTGSCSVMISSRSQPWLSRETHFDNVFGNGQFGNTLPSPMWLPEGSVITVQITDLSGSTNQAIMLLKGERVYV